MKYILDYLKEYCEADYYPLHMPGHKRSQLPFPNPYGIDITEITGFDNLHHAEGILKAEKNRALYTRMGTARDTVPLLAHLGRSDPVKQSVFHTGE